MPPARTPTLPRHVADTAPKAPSAVQHIAQWTVSAGPHILSTASAGRAVDVFLLLSLNCPLDIVTGEASAAAAAQRTANALRELERHDRACDSLPRLAASSVATTATKVLRSVAQLCSILTGASTHREEPAIHLPHHLSLTWDLARAALALSAGCPTPALTTSMQHLCDGATMQVSRPDRQIPTSVHLWLYS